MQGIVLLNNPSQNLAKQIDIRKLFKLASLYRPDQSAIYISFISGFETNEIPIPNIGQNNEEIKNDEEIIADEEEEI